MAVEQRRGQQSPNKFDPKLEDRKGTKLVSKRFRQLLRRYHRCTIPCLFIDFGNFNLSLSNRTSEMMIDQIHVPASCLDVNLNWSLRFTIRLGSSSHLKGRSMSWLPITWIKYLYFCRSFGNSLFYSKTSLGGA